MEKILGVGNALVDIIKYLKNDDLLKNNSIPKGSKNHLNKEEFNNILKQLDLGDAAYISGGSVANTIQALSRLDIKSNFIGRVGNDEYGEQFEKDFQEAGVDPVLIQDKGDTGQILHLFTPKNEEATVVGYSGVNTNFSLEDVRKNFLTGYSYLFIDGYLSRDHELLEGLAALADKHSMKIIFDLASGDIAEGHKKFLKTFIKENVSILFANDWEVFSYTGQEPEKALKSIGKDVDILVVKLGNRGSYIKKGDFVFSIPSYPVKLEDPTGAGDLYAAGFLYSYLHGKHLTQCGKMGAFMASQVIKTKGTRFSEEKWREIATMLH
jgi:sugar/nucleoside kinase (ribokinase family)